MDHLNTKYTGPENDIKCSTFKDRSNKLSIMQARDIFYMLLACNAIAAFVFLIEQGIYFFLKRKSVVQKMLLI